VKYRFLVLIVFVVGMPAAWAADPPAKEKEAAAIEVPYRLTDTKHVLVRAKLNGKGPFNFILDTGAPAVFIPKKVAKKIGIEVDEKGWGNFDSFELEGGLKVPKARTRVEDLFQLEGMNGMGLAGVELHGVIGYNLLARFRITYDFTQDKLKWVPLNFEPPAIQAVGKGGEGQGSLDMMGSIAKMLAGFMGIKPNFEVFPAGFLGVEFEEKKSGLFIAAVFKDSPAEKAGFKVGDQLESFRGTSIDDLADFRRAIVKTRPDDELKATLRRGDDKKTVTITLGKGL
jgi:hypothetical protein